MDYTAMIEIAPAGGALELDNPTDEPLKKKRSRACSM